MSHPSHTAFGPKARLGFFAAFAFFSVLSITDAAEHFRAWRTAATWTEEQRASAGAPDAARIFPVSAALVVSVTACACLSILGALGLGISVASGAGRAKAATSALLAAAAAAAGSFAASVLAYRVLVGARSELSGPVFNYTVSLQLTIVMSAFALAAGVLALIIGRARARPSQGSRAAEGEKNA
jgi:hypothetical protein